MKKLRTLWIISFSVALLTTLTMAGGGVMLPLGASIGSGTVILLGILFIIHGIYGVLFYWIWFARTARRYRVAKAVEGEGIYSAAEISARLKKNRDSVNRDLRYCIRKGYLKNLSFNGNYVVEKTGQ